MNTLLNRLKTAALSLGLCVLCFGASAQQPVIPRLYPLTNTTTFTYASTGTNIAGSGTAIINSQPFPIWRGRGFTFNISCVATDTTTANVTATFQFANPVAVNSSTYITNWNTVGKVTAATALNSTTAVFNITNIPMTVVDNLTIGRLQTLVNGHTNTITVSSTNCYISIIP